MNIRWTVSTPLLLLASVARSQPQPDAARAIVVAPGNSATLVRSGFSSGLSARIGDLLFAGDTLKSNSGEMVVWFCPSRSEYRWQGLAEIRIEPTQLTGSKPSGTMLLPVCELPSVDRRNLGRGSFFDSPESSTTSLQATTPVPNRELEQMLSRIPPAIDNRVSGIVRGSLYAKYGFARESAAEYTTILKREPEADWPRILVHEQREKIRKSQAFVPDDKAAPSKAKLFAVCVGISKYSRLKEEDHLQFADRDAKSVCEHFQSPRGGAVPAEQVVVLLNDQATTAAVRHAIAGFLRTRAGPADTIVLFIAGHGVVTERGGFILTYDSDPEDPAATALPMIEIQSLLDGELTHISRVFTYVDACRAGSIGTSARNGNRIHVLFDKLLASHPTKTFGLLASGPEELSFESERFGGGHGAFSYFLLNGLSGEADEDADRRVDAGELFAYVFNNVRKATLKRQNPVKSGILEAAAVITEDTSQQGIILSGWRSIEPRREARVRQSTSAGVKAATASSAAEQRLRDAIENGRYGPGDPASPAALLRNLADGYRDRPDEYLRLTNIARTSLQDKGQEILLRYLHGDRLPQRATDFLLGASLFAGALQIDPQAWALEGRRLFCEGRAKSFAGDYGSALADLERAARLEPDGAFVYNAIGIVYLELARYKEAISAFRDAIRLAPFWLYPRHNLALALAEMGDYEAASDTYSRVIESQPDAAFAHYNRALLDQRLQRNRQARKGFERGPENRPESAAVLECTGSSGGCPQEPIGGGAALPHRFVTGSERSLDPVQSGGIA